VGAQEQIFKMETTKVKRFLEGCLLEAKDASTKEKIKELLDELESSGLNNEGDPGTVPKPVLRKVVDRLSKILIKIAEHEAIDWFLDKFD
jgi:hypothetical protein